MTFAPYDRPVRAAFVGLGRIYDLNMRAYVDNPDVEVVALVDPSEERRAQRQADWPGARTFARVHLDWLGGSPRLVGQLRERKPQLIGTHPFGFLAEQPLTQQIQLMPQ